MARSEFICPICRKTILAPASLAGESAPCPRCGMEVDPWPQPEKPPEAPAAPEAAWYYSLGGEQKGPVSEAELKAMLDEGRLERTDLVWREGMADWLEANHVPEFKPRPVARPVARRRVDDDDKDEEDFEPRRKAPRRKWRRQRDPQTSYAVPIVVGGVVILALVGVAVFIGALVYGISEGKNTEYGKRLEFNGGELFYTSSVSVTEARRLGRHMVSGGFFDGDSKSVQLTRSGRTYQVRYVIKNGWEHDEGYINVCRQYARELSQEVFNGAPTEIHLCNEHFRTIQVVRP